MSADRVRCPGTGPGTVSSSQEGKLRMDEGLAGPLGVLRLGQALPAAPNSEPEPLCPWPSISPLPDPRPGAPSGRSPWALLWGLQVPGSRIRAATGWHCHLLPQQCGRPIRSAEAPRTLQARPQGPRDGPGSRACRAYSHPLAPRVPGSDPGSPAPPAVWARPGRQALTRARRN